MLELWIVVGRALALGLRGHRELVLENLALRQQLMAMKRATRRPHIAGTRPTVLDGPAASLEQLADGSGARATRDRRRLAS